MAAPDQRLISRPDRRTIVDLLRQRATTDPERVAITVAGTPISYGDLDARSDHLSAALRAGGMRPGDHAAVLLRNGPDFLTVWLGLAKAGVVEVPLHTDSRADGLVHALSLTRARMVIAEPDLAPRVQDVADRLPHLRDVVTTGRPLQDLISAGEGAAVPPPPADSDVSAVLFTSGTTGPSKGVVLTHRANTRLAATVAAGAGLRAGDVLFTTFPLFHVAARYVSTLAAMLVDGRVVIRQRFSASRFWQECAEEGVTAIHYLGSLLTILLAQDPDAARDRDHGVRVGYGAGAPAPVAEAFIARFGVPLRELYGMTETGMVTMNTAAATRLGTCGREIADCEVRIVDDDDELVPPGTTGEIVVRPRQPHIMIERYIGMPEATLAAFRNLWFHTGDVGRMDADGYLTFVGRSKDAIRRRGENVSAFEVEAILEDHPDIAGSAVIGVPDAISGEEILAVLELRDGAVLDPAALRRHCAARMPAFAVPRYLAVTDRLPRNASQRVEKQRLREAGLPPDAVDTASLDEVPS